MNGLGFIDLSLSRASAHWKCPGSPGPLGVKACRRTGSHVMWPRQLSFLSGLSVNQMEKFKCLLSHCLRFLKPGLSQMNLLKFMKIEREEERTVEMACPSCSSCIPKLSHCKHTPSLPLNPKPKTRTFQQHTPNNTRSFKDGFQLWVCWAFLSGNHGVSSTRWSLGDHLARLSLEEVLWLP